MNRETKLMVLFSPFLLTLTAFDQTEPESAVDLLIGILVLALGALFLGLAIGALAFLSNHLFTHRSALTYKVFCVRPKISLLVGVMITLLVLALIQLFGGIPHLQVLLLVAYLWMLLLFGAGASVRRTAHFVEPSALKDELPGLHAHTKGGLILVGANLVVVLGNLLFLGVLVAGVGAALISYFASAGSAAASIVQTKEEEKPPAIPPPPPVSD